jgi:multidrug efflux system membrane fusion protein
MFSLVQIVGDANNGVWVLGLPETVRLITVGQEYATSGAIVDVVMDGEANRGVAAVADGEQGDN